MSHGELESRPLWADLAGEAETRPPLAGDGEAEVCVVGAGIAGMTTAYLLTQAGIDVTVLDAGQVGSGETGRSTAHLSSGLDDGYPHLRKMFGDKGARLIATSHAEAIDTMEAIAAAEGIACDFRRVPAYLFADAGQDSATLDEELEAAAAAGLQVEMVARAPLPGYESGRALRFSNQARMDPLRYVRGLAGAIQGRGARIYTDCRVVSVTGGEQAHVTTASGHRITADHVVVATHVPINDLIAIHTKQEASRSYVIAAPVEAGEITDALYWDLADPYHYVRLAAGPDGETVLIVGGQDHRTGRPADGAERWARLEQWARACFPGMGAVKWRWSGQIIEPVDAIPFIGRNPMDAENVYTATGDSGDGTTNGTIAARLITDLILGHENPYAELYEASRLTVKATAEFARTNLTAAQHYGDWLTPGDVSEVGAIPPGGGAIMRDGLSKIAVYRDEAGSLHKCSAVCPHLKCIVGWNDAEKSWDCPCHGSRFDRYGRLVNGPANEGLGEP